MFLISLHVSLIEFLPLLFDTSYWNWNGYIFIQEEKDALSHSQSPDITSTKKKKSVDVTHLAMVMAFIYSMVKQDYLMQVMNDVFLWPWSGKNEESLKSLPIVAGKDCVCFRSQDVIRRIRKLLPNVVFAPLHKWRDREWSLGTYSLNTLFFLL